MMEREESKLSGVSSIHPIEQNLVIIPTLYHSLAEDSGVTMTGLA